MEFTQLSDVPAEIAEFYFEDQEGFHMEAPGELKALKDLERIIALGRTNANIVLSKFAPMVSRGLQWQWHMAYLEYLTLHSIWLAASSSFVSVEGSVFTQQEPLKPTRPIAQTDQELLAPYWGTRRAEVLKRAKITTTLGNEYDADELSINRLTMALMAVALQADSYQMPWSLASTATGVMTLVTVADLREAQMLAALNMSSIWST